MVNYQFIRNDGTAVELDHIDDLLRNELQIGPGLTFSQDYMFMVMFGMTALFTNSGSIMTTEIFDKCKNFVGVVDEYDEKRWAVMRKLMCGDYTFIAWR